MTRILNKHTDCGDWQKADTTTTGVLQKLPAKTWMENLRNLKQPIAKFKGISSRSTSKAKKGNKTFRGRSQNKAQNHKDEEKHQYCMNINIIRIKNDFHSCQPAIANDPRQNKQKN